MNVIAIPTFNRVRELVACLTCLREARGLERWQIFIRDDASTEYGNSEIARLVPEAGHLVRNATNLGADANQMLLFRDCLAAGAKRVLVLDSDMIVSPQALEFAEATLARTDGLLGLYNSVLHRELGSIDADLIEKRTIGGAATLWEAPLLARIAERCAQRATVSWDHVASEELRAMQRRIIVARRSYAQHLGLVGTNNWRFGEIEYGRGFVIETESQARFMAASFDRLMTHQRRFLPRRRRRSRLRQLLAIVKRS